MSGISEHTIRLVPALVLSYSNTLYSIDSILYFKDLHEIVARARTPLNLCQVESILQKYCFKVGTLQTTGTERGSN